MANSDTAETPLLTLLSLLSTSIHAIEAELKAAHMPPFTLEPQWHPLDSFDAVPSPRLYEARRVAMASANMIKALVQDVGTAMLDMSTQSLDQAAYILTADIRLLDVFKTDQEKRTGLHVDEMVARLPAGKKVDPDKLARCLRLLSTEHWWIEVSRHVFAPLRWALLNTPGSPSWAWGECARRTGDGRDAASQQHDPGGAGMEGQGYLNLASIKADYPWGALPPNTTFVDVGAGQGSVSLHILKHVYDSLPGLKVVLQDRAPHLDEGRRFWARKFPEALQDGRVAFEPHDFFERNPRKSEGALHGVLAQVHHAKVAEMPFETILGSIDNDASYKPIEAPYPIPRNGGFASKAAHRSDILMYALINGLERTTENFEKIIREAGFKINRIYPTRGTTMSIIELTIDQIRL
ncbi:hypothetical protein C8Q80DRAFT_1276390 [Daedaleopsis nitida]|nr:hypothetical protein C8Q80DRAFT_1276390 [Daedaleopsis nitida]